MRVAICVLCLLIANLAHAIAYTSNGTGGGNWIDPATWSPNGRPRTGDTAVILARDVVTVTDTEFIGTSPGNTTTYDLDISGDLVFGTGGARSLDVYSSIRVNAGGVIRAGNATTDYDCSSTFHLYMRTNAAGQKYTIYLNEGKLQLYGCSTYHGSSATVVRARIASCSPDCTAGAGRTVTLDRDVNWNPSTGSWDAEKIIVGVGGSLTAPGSADDPEQITSWGAPAANQIDGVTFAENHQPGDIVYNANRNILIQSDSATVHSMIYTSDNFDDPYDPVSYVQIDEFGDSTTADLAAISQDNQNQTLGTIDYIAVTNVEDGGNTACFALETNGWNSFEGNLCFDPRGGYGMYMFGMTANYKYDPLVIKDLTVMGSANSDVGRCLYLSGVRPSMDVDGLWGSHCYYGIQVGNGTTISFLRNSMFHFSTREALLLADFPTYYITNVLHIMNNEFRNGQFHDLNIGGYGQQFYIANNDFDNTLSNCLYISATYRPNIVHSKGNTFDNCNMGSSANYGAIYIRDVNGFYYFNQEEFGQTEPNEHNNISLKFPQRGVTDGGHLKGVCNDCLFATPDLAQTVGNMKTGIWAEGTAWEALAYAQGEWSFAFHNYNSVEDDHIGWGPGGMVFQRQTAVNYTTSNIKLQITPTSATFYGCLPVGSFSVDEGDAVSVSVYLRKDEAIATDGRRPKLTLEGAGFSPVDDYDEMSDVTNTWEQVTVSGTAAFKGLVHMKICAINTWGAADDYTPTWPVTLDVYADGIEVQK